MMTRTGRALRALAALSVLAVGACATMLSREELATEYYNIGTAYYELDQLDKSATYLSRAIELEPELARASYNLARVYVLQERHDEAIALLERLLEEDPNNALVMETLAYANYEAGRLDAAAEWYDLALEISPTDVDLLTNRATVALGLGNARDALVALRTALEYADDPELFLRVARAEDAAGNAGDALAAYREYVDAVESPPPAALLEYAEVLEREEFYAEALDVLGNLAESREATPDEQAGAHFARARLLLTEAEEAEIGLEALRAAVGGGFSDSEAASALLENEDLTARPDVESILEEAGLLEDGEPGEEPVESESDGGNAAPGPDESGSPNGAPVPDVPAEGENPSGE
ncbi:MAG: tetratricopeptide repeat protein [Spirochaetota bacterium]